MQMFIATVSLLPNAACTSGLSKTHQPYGSALRNAAKSRPPKAGSIHLLNCWATRASARRGCAARHATHVWHAAATRCLVHLHHYRVHHPLDLLLLRLELILLSELVLVEPVQGLLHRLLDLFFVAVFKFVLEFFLVQSVPHCEAVIFQAVFCLDLLLVGLIFCPVPHVLALIPM